MTRPRLVRPLTALALVLVAWTSTGCGAASMSADASAPMQSIRRESMGDRDMMAEDAPSKSAPSFGGIAQVMPAAPSMEPAPPPPPPPKLPPQGQPPEGPAARAGAGAEREDAVVIYTADLVVAVFEVQESIEKVAAIAKAQGGFLARRDDRSITIRVPSRRFDDTVKKLEAVGDVLSRNVTAEDVSEEFHDLQIQLRNLMAMRERLVVLLGKAQKVEEAIAVERELGRVSGEIDRIQGRLKFLADRAALSTITVSLEPRAPQGVQTGPFLVPLPWIHDLGIDRLINL